MKKWMTLCVLCAFLLALAGSVTAQGPDSEGQGPGAEGQGPVPQTALGTAFTYQGRLTDGGAPANGNYDFRFTLYDGQSGRSQVGTAVNADDVAVADGLFAALLDFGANAFTGQARYLEVAVRPGSSTGSYTALSPRQPLAAAPYALYAARAPWSGLSGVPAGFADGTDADTTYTAGAGLSLSGIQFRVDFAGSGSSNNVARADHHHLGQTWSGSNNPLQIGGSFGSPGYAPLVLSNSHASGSGLRVTSAGDDGLYVRSVGRDGVYVYQAARDGFTVYQAGSDGVYVGGVGSPSTYDYSGEQHGFEVGGAEGCGLRVGRADDDGVHVNSAGQYGVRVASAGWDGVTVDSAARHGVRVASAGYDGVTVDYAGGDGVRVASVGGDGVQVERAGVDGVRVYRAGSPSTQRNSSDANGFEVAGAEGNGLYVGRADKDGVHVASAGFWAGYFGGSVYVGGALIKPAGSFKIDHPLDPENKYLYHSFVESPDMMNVYNGNVTTDEDGTAAVTLPDYFEALNRDYRYQLTVIGTFAQAIIAREIENGQFVIHTDKPEVKVSWQVTGIRHDPYAEAHRIPVEEEKPVEERGTYLQPGAYGLPEERGLAYKLEAQKAGEEGP